MHFHHLPFQLTSHQCQCPILRVYDHLNLHLSHPFSQSLMDFKAQQTNCYEPNAHIELPTKTSQHPTEKFHSQEHMENYISKPSQVPINI